MDNYTDNDWELVRLMIELEYERVRLAKAYSDELRKRTALMVACNEVIASACMGNAQVAISPRAFCQLQAVVQLQ